MDLKIRRLEALAHEQQLELDMASNDKFEMSVEKLESTERLSQLKEEHKIKAAHNLQLQASISKQNARIQSAQTQELELHILHDKLELEVTDLSAANVQQEIRAQQLEGLVRAVRARIQHSQSSEIDQWLSMDELTAALEGLHHTRKALIRNLQETSEVKTQLLQPNADLKSLQHEMEETLTRTDSVRISLREPGLKLILLKVDRCGDKVTSQHTSLASAQREAIQLKVLNKKMQRATTRLQKELASTTKEKHNLQARSRAQPPDGELEQHASKLQAAGLVEDELIKSCQVELAAVQKRLLEALQQSQQYAEAAHQASSENAAREADDVVAAQQQQQNAHEALIQAIAKGDENSIAAAKAKLTHAAAALQQELQQADVAAQSASAQHEALRIAHSESNAQQLEAEFMLEDLMKEIDFNVPEFHTRTAAQSMAEKAAAKLRKKKRTPN